MLTTFATALTYTIGPGREASDALAIAAGLVSEGRDVQLRLRVTWAIWLVALCSGRYAEALELSEEFARLARSVNSEDDRANEVIGARLRGMSLLYLGRVGESKVALKAALTGVLSSNQIVRMQYDQELTARAFYSMTLYLMGAQDAASDLAARNIADAGQRGHATTFALSLVDSGLPVAYYCGEAAAFAERLETLRDVSSRYAFGPWRAWQECFRGSLHLSRSEFSEAEAQLAKGLAMLDQTGWPIRRAMFICHRAKALSALGRREEALTSLDAAITACRAHAEFWILPELLRVRAAVTASGRSRAAEGYLEQSWDMSMALGLRAWSLRTATTAASQLPGSSVWRSRLHAILSSVTEGQSKPDYKAAAALLRSGAAPRFGGQPLS